MPGAGKDKLQLANAMEIQYVPNSQRYINRIYIGNHHKLDMNIIHGLD